jgi:hypothetical protein
MKPWNRVRLITERLVIEGAIGLNSARARRNFLREIIRRKIERG